METLRVGIHEAKTQLSKLIERVKNGENVTITQRGRPVATLTAFDEAEHGQRRARAAIAQIRRFRDRQRPLGEREARKILKAGQR